MTNTMLDWTRKTKPEGDDQIDRFTVSTIPSVGQRPAGRC